MLLKALKALRSSGSSLVLVLIVVSLPFMKLYLPLAQTDQVPYLCFMPLQAVTLFQAS